MQRNRGKEQNGKDQTSLRKWNISRDGIYARMGTIKDRNGKALTEAEETKRWQEYRGELNKKGLNELDNHDACGH